MKYSVAIKENSSGIVRLCPIGTEWDDWSESWWTEGNMGCDCNRYLCFERAGGNDPDVLVGECGHTRFKVLYAVLEDGTEQAINDNDSIS